MIKEVTMAALGDLILEELNYDGPKTLEVLVQKLNRHPADVRRAIALLAEEGLVEGVVRGPKKVTLIQSVRHG